MKLKQETKEKIQIPKFNTKILISLTTVFNITFLFALPVEPYFWSMGNGLFKFWISYNMVLLGLIFGIEKPKTTAGIVGIANQFMDKTKQVVDVFTKVNNTSEIFKDKTIIEKFSDKPEPIPIDEIEKSLEELEKNK